jgi:polyisoprenoid-binding protein YceI
MKGIAMKSSVLAIGILALAASVGLAQTPVSTWTSDAAHSEVDFSITHMSISNIHGRFGNVVATILWNEAAPAKSAVSATIDVTSLDTGVAARDTHLKTDAFFDVAKFSTATFASTSAAKTASGLTVRGNLTLHGVTKPVVLTVEGPTGPVPGMQDHKPHAGFTATTTISRTAFGIGTAFPAAAVGDDVKLTIELEVVKQ